MGFLLPDRYVWDFWTVRDGATTHLFYLNAPRDIPHPDDRHLKASVGHATSTDLVHWKNLGPTIGPSPGPAWDDSTTWTGCTIKRPDGRWMMFYTGTSKGEKSKVQRIGAALSDDLHHWEKLPENPLLVCDPTWYEKYDLTTSGHRPHWDEAWRDPWVYADPHGPANGGKGWRMLFTARAKSGAERGRGVIAQATSPDLVTWTAGPPLTNFGYYAEMEVPQLFQLDGWWFCLFCNGARNQEAAYAATGKSGGNSGTHYLRSKSPDGPFELVEHRFFAGDPNWRLYAGRMVPGNDGKPRFMAFINNDGKGRFVGGLTDPMPMWVTPEGLLRVDARAYGIPPREDAMAG